MFLSLQNKENQAYKPSLVYFVFSHFLGSLQKNDLFVEPKIFISTAHILASFLLFLFMDFVQKDTVALGFLSVQLPVLLSSSHRAWVGLGPQS